MLIKAYHGTNQVFNQFQQSKARVNNDYFGGGVGYFSDSYDTATTYAAHMVRLKKAGTKVIYTVNLDLKNTFDVDKIYSGKELEPFYNAIGMETFARGAGLLKPGPDDKYTILGRLENGKISLPGQQVFKGLSGGMVSTAKTREILKKLGYDSLRYNGGENMRTGAHNVYLPYYPEQIKIVKTDDLGNTIKRPSDHTRHEPIAVHEDIVPSELNLARDLMPQVTDDIAKDLLRYLNFHGIKYELESVPMGLVKATQGELDFDKVFELKSGDTSERTFPYIISREGYIVDGHHGGAADILNHVKLIEVFKIDMSILDIITLLNTEIIGRMPDVEDIDEAFERRVLGSRPKKLVFTFGRFNPPTIGHALLIKKIVALAKMTGADARIYTSQTQDSKKNPLSYSQKIAALRRYFPYVSIMNDPKIVNFMMAIKQAEEDGYKDIVMVVGEDRTEEFQRVVTPYIKSKDSPGYDPKKNYDISSFSVVSAGERDPDAEGVQGMSASKMREFVKNGDLKHFILGTPNPRDVMTGRQLFIAVKKGMNIPD